MKLFEMKQNRHIAATGIEAIVLKAGRENRGLTDCDQRELVRLRSTVNDLDEAIAARGESSLASAFRERGPEALLGGGAYDPTNPDSAGMSGLTPPNREHPMASQFRSNFGGWVNNQLRSLGGGIAPTMEATSPSGPVSIGSGSGVDSIAITVPTAILAHLASYYALDSFGMAGATTIFTDHTRPLTKPILSAGAPDAVIAENAAAGISQPFGLSGFTFGGVKYERLVLASYEALMNSELPLQGAIMDELLASIANTLTTAATTSFVAALTAAASTLAVGVNGSGGSIYTSMVDLRHAVPPRFDLPSNVFMLSRATLAQVRNTRASTSGIPLFSPDGTKIFDRPYVINDNLDTTSGAGVGFVAFGSFADGVFLRRTPVITRTLLELYAGSGAVGFRTTQWADQHFLAELAGAAQPPTFQPVFYTNIVSES
jgi:HK97 family phage major capsid protein